MAFLRLHGEAGGRWFGLCGGVRTWFQVFFLPWPIGKSERARARTRMRSSFPAPGRRRTPAGDAPPTPITHAPYLPAPLCGVRGRAQGSRGCPGTGAPPLLSRPVAALNHRSLSPSLSPSPSTVLAALATLAAAARTGAATGVPDPFPSLRSVGDTLHTTLAGLTQNKSEGVSPALAGLKEGASEASHKVSAYIHGAKNPFGDLTMEAWHKLDDEAWAAYNKTGGGKCDPATRPQFAGTVGTFKGLLEAPLSFAFSGSGTLLPFHEGVIQGLQDRGVLTDEVMREAAFGGVSGGAITAVLTALGMPGQEQYTLFLGIVTGIAICQSRYPDPLDKKLNCTLQSVGLPILAKVLQTKYPDAVKIINGRVNVWACQVRREGKSERVFFFSFLLLLLLRTLSLPFLALVFFTSPHLHLHRPPHSTARPPGHHHRQRCAPGHQQIRIHRRPRVRRGRHLVHPLQLRRRFLLHLPGRRLRGRRLLRRHGGDVPQDGGPDQVPEDFVGLPGAQPPRHALPDRERCQKDRERERERGWGGGWRRFW